jgi:8-oxo-dGTP diphosphatase
MPTAVTAVGILKGRITLVQVVAALIWDRDRFLVCQRPAHKARGLLWEFVGGKVETGETPQDALIRECREELDIHVEVGDVYMQLVHVYPDLTVQLTLFHSRILSGIPKLLEHHDLRWILPSEIDSLDFCPADEEILARLKQDYRNAASE